MQRREALKTILQTVNKNTAIISSLGLMSRELFKLNDLPQTFYMTGSMGLVSSIGLGIAVNKSKIKVLVIDGDGSLLMNLGSLATIGHFRPKNLIHLVLDNEAYASCGKEPTISKTAKLDKLAQMVGYRIVKKVKTKNELERVLSRVLRYKNGPCFILAKIKLGGQRDLPRILNLDKITKRFKEFINQFN